MLADFLHFIRKQDLCKENEPILLAVSGGIDSMVLLDLFILSGFDVGVAHCNFQLRGGESDQDESFVKKKAEQLHLPFYQKKFDTLGYSKGQGVSIQMAARELRYEWFEEIRLRFDYHFIATAHHLNDHIETTLFNLFKGTGLHGLTGIPVRQGRVIRPLLFATKERIMEYARQKNIPFREDKSNQEVKYHRNMIRNRIIPLIEEVNPGFIKTMASTLDRLNETQRMINYWLDLNKDHFMKEKGGHIYLDRSFFQQINSPVILHEVLKSWGFQYDQCRNILKRKKIGSGALYYSETHVLNVDREFMILSPHMDGSGEGYQWEEGVKEIETKYGRFKKEIVHKRGESTTADPHVEFFNVAALKFPLVIRSWKEGDWFIPLGMKGKKKLSDFMIDEKIPVNLKQRLPVLLSEDAIIWVVGYRIDERFRIIPDNSQLLKITFEPFYDQSF
jgi:tRNA(Ile)-lysidine synthase